MASVEGTHRDASVLAGPRSLLEGAPVAMMRVGLDGCLRYGNRAAKTLLRAWNAGPGDRLPAPVPDLVRNALLGGTARAAEVVVDGRTFTLTTGLADKHGVPLYATDMTDMVNAESVMLQSGEMLLNVLAAAPMFLATVEADRTLCVYATGGLTLPADDPDGLTFDRAFQSHPLLLERLDAALRGNTESALHFNVVDEQTGRAFNVHASVIHDERGAVSRVMVAGMDVTDRQRHLEEIELREAQYRSIFETVTEGLLILSRGGRIVDANPAAATLLRTPGPELLGRRILPHVHPDHHDALRTMNLALGRGRPASGEIIALRADGASFDAELIVAPFLSSGESHVLVVLRDVSEERANRRALTRMNQRLESIVTDRTFALQTSRDRLGEQSQRLAEAYRELKNNHAQLAQSEKMASLGELAAGVAHEINNPVGYVMSNLRTMSEHLAIFRERLERAGAVDAEVAHHIDDADAIVRESLDGMAHVTEIIHGLKRFARTDDESVAGVDLNELVDTTLRVLHNDLKYTCAVEKELGDLPLITCNPGQINQVLMNLIVNARQAVDGRGTIAIRTWAHEIPGGRQVRVSVSDSGCGIPPENLARLFNPFFTTKPVGEGTGLGLSITYSIVKQHGGQISVESTEDVGSTFTVALPVEREARGSTDTLRALPPPRAA